MRLPPVVTVAPWSRASLTQPSITSSRRAAISGPIVTPSSSPLPTLIDFATSVKPSTNFS